MSRFMCCLGGGSSSKVVQDPAELPQLPQAPEPSDSSDSSGPVDSSETSDEEGFLNFQWNEIVQGTENFEITHLIGQGKVGKLYRCNFPRIHKVGAAKVNHGNTSGLGEFLAEIRTLHESDHPNVIKLLGKHYGQANTALVYQFMPNGSLDHHLFANARQVQGLTQATRVLDWDTRMRIAVGVAEGLVYVHQGLLSIHRDVKATNIVLDDNFVPKLTGFGTAAKIAYGEDGIEMQSKISKNGTEGYLAPETENFGLVSTKSDVYSYGVFLLVLFTGRKANDDRERPEAKKKLTDWLMPVLTRLEYAPMVVDVALGKKYSAHGLNRIFETARMCLNAQPLERPAMDFVETLVREAAAYLVPEEHPQVKERRCST
ncbi:PREDICTED: probable serine/threonine-protein kinase RLCKVII [Camelina sativa]|uniref:Probable serine/threonine-protein kinase RLCKVII n=1 Tax=Camelina sativa TaxID=90675 RepID=A0ABM1R9H6_CAMSA|nr:PREDICTED: probable serine/threonine-protein kinase RLCKVII [Camelina sativa]